MVYKQQDRQSSKAGKILRNLSQQDFLGFGLDHIGYIRPYEDEKHKGGYALYAANGALLSVQETLDVIIMLAHHNDLHPVTVH
jgi:hypothetical protein